MNRAYERDPEKFKTRTRMWNASHPARKREFDRRYYESVGKYKCRQHFFKNASSNLKSLTRVSIPPIVLWGIWKRQLGLCALTGRKLNGRVPYGVALDHIIPRAMNGPTIQANLQWVCYEANAAKQCMDVSEFLDLCRDVVTHADIMEAI